MALGYRNLSSSKSLTQSLWKRPRKSTVDAIDSLPNTQRLCKRDARAPRDGCALSAKSEEVLHAFDTTRSSSEYLIVVNILQSNCVSLKCGTVALIEIC